MAFLRANLARASSSGNTDAPAIWTYKTDDAHADVDTEDYFIDAINEIKLGDIIYVVVVTNLGLSNEATSTYGTHLCDDNNGTVIDVSNVTVGTVTKSD